MGYITIDIFTDENKAKTMKEKHQAMGHKVDLKKADGITVNECVNDCKLVYEKDASIYVLISESD